MIRKIEIHAFTIYEKGSPDLIVDFNLIGLYDLIKSNIASGMVDFNSKMADKYPETENLILAPPVILLEKNKGKTVLKFDEDKQIISGKVSMVTLGKKKMLLMLQSQKKELYLK